MEIRIGNDDIYAIVSSKGGTIREFMWYGRPIIYPEFQVGEKSRGGIPICFPFFGKMPGRFDALQRHGWLRHQELELVGFSDTHAVFHGQNEISTVYPWGLRYDVAAYFDEVGLNLKLTAERLMDGQVLPAPINPGFHPYFSSHGSNRIGHTVYAGSRKASDFQKDSTRISAEPMVFIDSGEWQSCMRLGGDFGPQSVLTLWSDNADEYFCVEPVLGDPASANTERGRFLGEGERLEISCCITFVYVIR